MSSEASNDEVRAELIRLLENDDWEITETRARKPGYPILRAMGLMPTDGAMIDYVTRLLRESFPMHPVPLGTPPGSGGTAYAMNNTNGRGLYIKVKIERNRIDKVLVLSFHVSDFYKG